MIRTGGAGVSTSIRGNSQQDIRGTEKNKSRVLFQLLLQRGEVAKADRHRHRLVKDSGRSLSLENRTKEEEGIRGS